MNEFWGALAVAIMSQQYLTPEQAFDRLEIGVPKQLPKRICRRDLTSQDSADMVKLKTNMTYQQIGDVYGLKADAVYNRIRRFKGIV